MEKEEDEDYELERMASVIKSKGGKMYKNNLDDHEDNDDIKIVNGKKNVKNKCSQENNEDDDITTDSDSESDPSENEDHSAAIPINEWDDKPVLTPAGKNVGHKTHSLVPILYINVYFWSLNIIIFKLVNLFTLNIMV